jgi:hypothetical protein
MNRSGMYEFFGADGLDTTNKRSDAPNTGRHN